MAVNYSAILVDIKNGGSQNSGPYKYVSTNGTINVIQDHKWAIFDGKNQKNIENVPSIILTEYQPIGSQTVGVLEKFIGNIKDAWETNNSKSDAFLDYYKELYNAKLTGNQYIFPYFNSSIRSKTNSWAKNPDISSAVDALGKLPYIGTAKAKLAAETVTAGNLGIEYPKTWQGTDAVATYSFEFYLHNTFSEENTKRNLALVSLLSYNNSYSRRNLAIQDAPVIYTVEIPGIRYSPFSVFKKLTIDAVGQMRKMKINLGTGEPLDIILPEAYKISIEIEDIFIESRQLLPASLGASKVVVLSDSEVSDAIGDVMRRLGLNGVQPQGEGTPGSSPPPTSQ